MSTVSELKSRQAAWASKSGQATNDIGYFVDASFNLPWLTDEIRADFDAADGHEFGRVGTPGKISAPHSSSALAVNTFSYWSARDKAALGRALNFDGIASIRFEQKYPTGVGNRSPNLDVVMESSTGKRLAIESKFCEPFSGRKKSPIQPKYFPAGKLWRDAGMPGAQEVAESCSESITGYEFLNVAQLLKHMLGLGKLGGDWRLLLLWFAPSPEIARKMLIEADRFANALTSDSIRFSAMTYQDFWAALSPYLMDTHRDYSDYMNHRYFSV